MMGSAAVAAAGMLVCFFEFSREAEPGDAGGRVCSCRGRVSRY